MVENLKKYSRLPKVSATLHKTKQDILKRGGTEQKHKKQHNKEIEKEKKIKSDPRSPVAYFPITFPLPREHHE